MLFETDDNDSRDFATIYRADYVSRKLGRPPICIPKLKFVPPVTILNADNEKILNTIRKNESLPEEKRSEDPEKYLKRVREQYPHLKLFPKKLPDEEMIECDEERIHRTLYEIDYGGAHDCKAWAIHRARPEGVTLPEGWTIPETMQQRSYRNPWKFMSARLLEMRKYGPHPNNLDPNHTEREILRITTGNTEYGEIICSAAEKILSRGRDKMNHT